MQTLWRTTASLIRKYPVLWLPLVITDTVYFGLGWTGRRLHHNLVVHIVSWLSQNHSVLSSTPVYAGPSPFTATVAAILTAPITWATFFTSTVLYTSAMLVTAALLANLSEKDHPLLQLALSTLKSCRRRILVFSLKFCGIFAVSLLLAAPLLAGAIWFQHFLETTPSLPLKFQIQLQKADLLGYVIEVPIMMAIAWIVAPMALKLLQPPGATPTPQARRTARIVALIVVAVTSTLEIFLPRIATAYLEQLNPVSSVVVYVVREMASLVAALPYVPLFIALTLISNPNILSTPETFPEPLPSQPQSPPESTSA